MACNVKTAGHRATRSEIWDLGVIVTCIWSTFDLLVFKVILGSFGPPISKWCVTEKWLAIEWNGVKFGTRV